MEWDRYASSKTYFDSSSQIANADVLQCASFRGRILALKLLGELFLRLPLGLLCKANKTLLRLCGFLFSSSFLCLTLGTSHAIRELFIRRVFSLATDLTDWVFLPFALLIASARLLLASLIHPALFLRF